MIFIDLIIASLLLAAIFKVINSALASLSDRDRERRVAKRMEWWHENAQELLKREDILK